MVRSSGRSSKGKEQAQKKIDLPRVGIHAKLDQFNTTDDYCSKRRNNESNRIFPGMLSTPECKGKVYKIQYGAQDHIKEAVLEFYYLHLCYSSLLQSCHFV